MMKRKQAEPDVALIALAEQVEALAARVTELEQAVQKIREALAGGIGLST